MLPILVIILIFLAYYFNAFIRIHSLLFYITAFLLTAISLIFSNSQIFEFLKNGTLGVSFLLIVMFTGAIKSGSRLKKTLVSIRGIYAILGFLFIIPHVYYYIFESLTSITSVNIIPIGAFLLLIPLFATSFKIVRQKLPTSSWINLHKIAYVVYVFIFIHLVSTSELKYVILYYLIFGIYFFLRLYYYFEANQLIKATTIVIITGSLSLLLINNAPQYFEDPYNIFDASEFHDGTYIGYTKGYQNLDTVVRVHIENNEIVYIIIDDCGCTPYIKNDIYGKAAYSVAFSIKEQNRTDVDAVSGVTATSNAINRAVIDALESAKK